MRTTISIDDKLLRAIKRRAADTDRTLSAVIEDAVRAELARDSVTGKPSRSQKVVTFKGNGVRPGVNLNSTAELIDLMEGAQ